MLKGEGTKKATVYPSADAISGNELKVSDAATTNGVYVLANHSGVVGFYKWNGGLLGAGKVYLPAGVSARDFIGFDETTGINAVEAKKAENNVYYNLNGQRVDASHKGLVIVNGKKYLSNR